MLEPAHRARPRARPRAADDQPRPVGARHDLRPASVVMYAGRIVERGRAVELFDHPRHPYARRWPAPSRRSVTRPSRFAPAGLPGDPPDPGELPTRLHVPSPVPARRVRRTCRRPRPTAAAPIGRRTRRRARVAAVPMPGDRARCPRDAGAASRTWSRSGTFTGATAGRTARAVDGVDLVGRRRARSSRWSASPGCGKTTLARTLLGLERPTGGRGAVRRAAAALRRTGAEGATGAGCSWSCRTRPAR